MGDNRNYFWNDEQIIMRSEYPYIEKWISEGAKVIDLGCGNGSLLRILKEKKKISEFGLELTETGVSLGRKNGLNIRQGRINAELNDITDNFFDYAICNVTSQMVMYPEITLQEMKRIAKYQIISFPNFAFLPQRFRFIV